MAREHPREFVPVPDRPSVLVNVQEAKRIGLPACIEVRFPGPYVELTTAGAAALEDDLRRARLAVADMQPDHEPGYPAPEIEELAVAARIPGDTLGPDVYAALLARIKQLVQREADEPF